MQHDCFRSLRHRLYGVFDLTTLDRKFFRPRAYRNWVSDAFADAVDGALNFTGDRLKAALKCGAALCAFRAKRWRSV
jgi:hypothetical protein